MLNLTGTDDASKQALADASERYTAAGSQIDQATTAKQALLAKESALEGLYYVRAARIAMGMDPGPELESLAGQKSAGTVTEDRRVEFEGREIEASPEPVASAPRTTTPAAASRAARFRPAGTPSRGGSRRWSPAHGAWARCCCSTHVLRHAAWATAQGFESGYGDGYSDGLTQARTPARTGGFDGGGGGGFDGAATAAAGGDWGGGDGGGWGGDFGGGDFGGDFGGF